MKEEIKIDNNVQSDNLITISQIHYSHIINLKFDIFNLYTYNY